MGALIITARESFDTGRWHLHATGHGRTAIAGERLFRGYPRPDIQFSHDTEEAALKDAAKLQAYLDNPPKKSRATNKRVGAFEELDDPVWKV